MYKDLFLLLSVALLVSVHLGCDQSFHEEKFDSVYADALKLFEATNKGITHDEYVTQLGILESRIGETKGTLNKMDARETSLLAEFEKLHDIYKDASILSNPYFVREEYPCGTVLESRLPKRKDINEDCRVYKSRYGLEILNRSGSTVEFSSVPPFSATQVFYFEQEEARLKVWSFANEQFKVITEMMKKYESQ